MKRNLATPVFKPYVMNQAALLPPSSEEVIPTDNLVRAVNESVEKIDVSALLAQYKGVGTLSYHPKMLLKVLVCAYAERIYSSRRIAKALRENIHFMWISGESRPDFRTINDFRGSRLKAVIEEVLDGVLVYLVGAGQVKLVPLAQLCAFQVFCHIFSDFLIANYQIFTQQLLTTRQIGIILGYTWIIIKNGGSPALCYQLPGFEYI